MDSLISYIVFLLFGGFGLFLLFSGFIIFAFLLFMFMIIGDYFLIKNTRS